MFNGRRCLLVRQSFFDNNLRNFTDVGGGVLGCRGFHSSFRTSQGGLPLNVDVSTTMIIQPGLVVDFLIANRNVKDPFSIDLAKSTSPVTIKRISYYEVLNATNKIGEENLIGKGSIGSVYKGIFSDKMIVAIKIFNLDLEGANHSFDTECKILCNILHRNLVKVISSCSKLDLKALVMEYMPNGNLTKWLSSSYYFLNLAQRLEIMIDVASALGYLHYGYPYPIVHCDLKPSNKLLDEDMVAHVADFGIAKLFTEDQRILITKTLGTIGYMLQKPTDDMFVGEFTMRKWVLESFPNEIMHIVDVDLVNAAEDNIRVKESCFKLIMEVALECTTDLPEERHNAKDVLTRLKKIKT
ncbi:unnamed protein product [Fraxinus pennsylvanica]|uniref:Protein kinase domain-containing protein n=1 Tax=Fraxinus pennsylvanica TaxID=56036 RepID=A0AAD1YW68_9LAMI|nr:unnamed protein product [Fraxinus pennsylvanica]